MVGTALAPETLAGPSEALEEWSGHLAWCQRPRSEARKKICDLFFSGKEASLAASRYIEGHALTLCKKNSIQAEIKHTASSYVVSRATPHSHAAREWGGVPWHAKVQMPTKKIGMKSGAAQAALAAPLPMALIRLYRGMLTILHNIMTKTVL